MSSSQTKLGLTAVAVVGLLGWAVFQGITHWIFTTPTVLQKSGDSVTADTSPNFNVSYMPADSYLNSHRNFLDVDHQGYLDMGMYAGYFAVEIQYKDENPITIQGVRVDNALSCTTPIGPGDAEVGKDGEEILDGLSRSVDRLSRSLHEIMIMPEVVYPKSVNFGAVFYLISRCSPWIAQIETDRGTVSYK